MQSSNIEENIKRLAHIRKSNPSSTHIYIRRANKDNLVVDIPISQAEFIIRNQPTWIVESSNKQMDDVVEALFLEPEEPVASDLPQGVAQEVEEVVVPPKPSETPTQEGFPMVEKKKMGRPKGSKNKV